MKASVGDILAVASGKLDGPVRDGRIVELRHEDGSPPYLVEWTDSGQRSLVFPGPDATVRPVVGEAPVPGTAPGPEAPGHVRRWRVELDLFEAAGETSAHAVLVTEAPVHLDSHGHAKLRAGDTDVPEIGDEIAVARALRRLSDRLLGVAAGDVEAIEGHPVSLTT